MVDVTPANPEAGYSRSAISEQLRNTASVERLIERLDLSLSRMHLRPTEIRSLVAEVRVVLTAANARVAEEREACAKICLHVREIVGASTGSSIAMALSEAADRIRARGRNPA